MSKFKFIIENNYTYQTEGDTDAVEDLCKIKEQNVYKWSFLLKDSANPKWHISKYNLKEYRALYGKCKKHDKEFAIPMKSYRKAKKNIVNIPVFKEKYVSFYERSQMRFPTGWLFSRVIKPLKSNGHNIDLEDERKDIDTDNEFKRTLPYPLRYYQQRTLNLALSRHRLIVHLATGGGKTLIGMAIIKDTGASTLFIVPSLSLLHQTYRKVKAVFGEEHVGRIGDNITDIRRVTIATVQSLWSKKDDDKIQELLDRVDIMILDEAHHVNTNQKGSNTWYQIAMQCKAKIRIGLTATPGKETDKNFELLRAATGSVGISKSIKDLTNEGFLCPAKIYMIPIRQEGYNHWKTAVKQGIHLNDNRNTLVAKYAKYFAGQGENVVITVDRIKTQAQELIKLLPEANTAFGDTSTADRKKIFKKLRESKGNILISSVVNEGWDCPSASVLIDPSGRKGGNHARGKIQQIGRVLRKEEGKDEAIIIDFFDKDNSTLQKHSRFRYNQYKDRNFDVSRTKPFKDRIDEIDV